MEIEKQIDELTHERWRFSFIDRNIYFGYILVSGNADRTPDQPPTHNILPLFQYR